MSSLSVSNTFVAGTTGVASQVNTNFSDITNYINDRNSGNSKWDQLTVAGNASIDGTLTIGGSSFLAMGTDGWAASGETWTYASTTSFTISGDKTSKYAVGDKIKLTQTTTKYYYVTGVTYSAPNTTINVIGYNTFPLTNSAITSPYYSKVSSPSLFPRNFTIDLSLSGFSSTTINEAVFSMDGYRVMISYNISGTSNSVNFIATTPFLFPDIIGNRGAYQHVGYSYDNGGLIHTAIGYPSPASNDLHFLPLYNGSWTTSGTKSANGTMIAYL